MSTNSTPVIVKDVSVSGLDMVLPAALLFLISYYPLYLLVRSGGVESDVSSNILLVLFFAAIYGICYIVKFYLSRNNIPMTTLIRLTDANVGLPLTNIAIIVLSLLCAILSCFTGHANLFAAFVVIAIAFSVNIVVGPKYWELEETGSGWSNHHNPQFSPIVPQVPTGKKVVQITFSWDSILQEKGISSRGEDVTVSFLEPDYLDDSSPDYVRKDNPFFNDQPEDEDDYPQFAAVVKAGSKDPFEQSALSLIIQSAEDLCKKYNLPDYEMYDLLLKFCQNNIKYVVDEESQSIGCIPEYFRFAGESLFDREGDCDCKSVLAYKLFEMLGADAELVCVSIRSDDNPYGKLNHAAIILRDSGKCKIKLPASYKQEILGKVGRAVYCDATADGYLPGYCVPEMDKDSVTVC